MPNQHRTKPAVVHEQEIRESAQNVMDAILQEPDPVLREERCRQILEAIRQGVLVVSADNGKLLEVRADRHGEYLGSRVIQDRVVMIAFHVHLDRWPESFEEARDHIMCPPFCAECMEWIRRYKQAANLSLVYATEERLQ